MSILRVVSYNIHKGRSALGGRESLYDVRLGLYGLQPDLVFLQEVQGRNAQSGILDAQHEALAAGLQFEVAYGRNAVRRETDHGNALLSRYPIIGFENQDISDHALEQRGLLHAKVFVQETEVHCFVVHLGLFAVSRVRQVQALADRIERLVPADAPVLIAGDFNDWTNRLSPLFVQRLGLHEVFSYAQHTSNIGMPRLRDSVKALRQALQRGAGLSRAHQRSHQLGHEGGYQPLPPPRTFPAAFPWLRLDRIYQRGFAVRSARVLRGKPWTQLSDHAPIVTELELP